MGGGPRTFPGGVSKWQWKRMQAKKSKQLLKARLARERQIYEMRKRAELKASLSELEKPWEVVEKAPTLFSVKADEQLKVLADRFQKPGGFDLWGEEDGPELFRREGDGKSAKFFPKGVVHSVKPYGGIDEICDLRVKRLVLGGSGSDLKEKSDDNRLKGNVFKKRRERKWYSNGSEEVSSRDGVLGEGNERRVDSLSGSEGMSLRGGALDEGSDGSDGSRLVRDGRSDGGLTDWRSVMSERGSGRSDLRAKRLDEMRGGRSSENRLRSNVFKNRRERNRNSKGLEEGSSREGVFVEGNEGRDFREVYDKREYRRVDSLNGSEGMGSREGVLDEGNGRRNVREVYDTREYRRQDAMNGSGKVALNEGSGRRNLRQVYNKREYSRQDGMNGSREGALDEGSGRMNLRHAYHKNGNRMQKSSNGSEAMSSREGALEGGSGSRNLRQVSNTREYRTQNSSEEVKGYTKAKVYDLGLERDEILLVFKKNAEMLVVCQVFGYEPESQVC